MECSICYDMIQPLQLFATKCNHHFCKSCITQWTIKNRTCPMCRKDLFKTVQDYDIERIQGLIVPYLTYLVENETFMVEAEIIYSKFFCFFNSFIKCVVNDIVDYDIFYLYTYRYKNYQKELYFVSNSFLETEEHPGAIFHIFLDLIRQTKEPDTIYICFNECLFFYNLKRGYTENQLQQLDSYKNNLHLTLTRTR